MEKEFLYPACVQIKNEKKRKEIIDFCKEIGWKDVTKQNDTRATPSNEPMEIICCDTIGNKNHDYAIMDFCMCDRDCIEDYRKNVFDCGKNIELFKALVSVNNIDEIKQWHIADVPTRFNSLKNIVKTENNQKYVARGGFFMPLIRKEDINGRWISLSPTKMIMHQATKEELIDHFSNKEK